MRKKQILNIVTPWILKLNEKDLPEIEKRLKTNHTLYEMTQLNLSHPVRLICSLRRSRIGMLTSVIKILTQAAFCDDKAVLTDRLLTVDLVLSPKPHSRIKNESRGQMTWA